MRGSASFSPCRRYRYTLWRRWAALAPKPGFVLWILCNPSTADEENNDPTITRCIEYTRSWGYAELCIANLWAFRSTDPKGLHAASDPVGIDNTRIILGLASEAALVMLGWGAMGSYQDRAAHLLELLPRDVTYMCLEKTKEGFPGHPLYLRQDLRPQVYRSAES